MRLSVLILILIPFRSLSQNCDRVLLTGQVIDSSGIQSFYNLMIVNRTTGQGVFGQPNGYFSAYARNNDSISISVKGYMIYGFRVKADSNCQSKQKIYLIPKPQELKEMVIKPLKTLSQIKEEREALAMRETRLVTGVDVLQSPITALYQAFSKKEQNKRWIAEQEYKDNKRKIVQELLRLYVASDIIELDEEEFDEFISFLNLNEDFLKTATEMELYLFIKDKYDHYKRIKNK
jgi:hypothetical protein